MKLHKIILVTMASVMILSVGANFQPTSVSARHVRTSKVRRHHTRRDPKKHVHRARKTRTKRHYTKKKVKHSKSKKLVVRKPQKRIHRGKAASGLAKYIYNISNPKILRTIAAQWSMSKAQLMHKYSKNGKSIKAVDLDGTVEALPELRAEAKDNHMSPLKLVLTSKPLTGKLIAYNYGGDHEVFNKKALEVYASENGESVKAFLKQEANQSTPSTTGSDDTTDTSDQNTTSTYDGPTTSEGTPAERDAIADLNKIRESKGIAPLTMDPTLEFIAEKRTQQMENPAYQGHFDSEDFPCTDDIDVQYNINSGNRAEAENIRTGFTESQDTHASKAGYDENQNWNQSHEQNREQSTYHYVGIGINSNGNTAEEFSM